MYIILASNNFDCSSMAILFSFLYDAGMKIKGIFKGILYIFFTIK